MSFLFKTARASRKAPRSSHARPRPFHLVYGFFFRPFFIGRAFPTRQSARQHFQPRGLRAVTRPAHLRLDLARSFCVARRGRVNPHCRRFPLTFPEPPPRRTDRRPGRRLASCGRKRTFPSRQKRAQPRLFLSGLIQQSENAVHVDRCQHAPMIGYGGALAFFMPHDLGPLHRCPYSSTSLLIVPSRVMPTSFSVFTPASRYFLARRDGRTSPLCHRPFPAWSFFFPSGPLHFSLMQE